MKITIPLWLSLLLIPILAVTFFVVHHFVQTIATDVGIMPNSREFELAGLLLSSILGPTVTALAFSYPIARMFGRHSMAAAVLISAPTIIFRASFYINNSGRPFVIAIFAIEVIALAVLVPIGAWLVHRKRASSERAASV